SELAASVVALTRVALRIFVGQDAGHCFADGRTRDVFASNQLEVVFLAVDLMTEDGGDFTVDFGKGSAVMADSISQGGHVPTSMSGLEYVHSSSPGFLRAGKPKHSKAPYNRGRHEDRSFSCSLWRQKPG